jgi:hypothetical protein
MKTNKLSKAVIVVLVIGSLSVSGAALAYGKKVVTDEKMSLVSPTDQDQVISKAMRHKK